MEVSKEWIVTAAHTRSLAVDLSRSEPYKIAEFLNTLGKCFRQGEFQGGVKLREVEALLDEDGDWLMYQLCKGD